MPFMIILSSADSGGWPNSAEPDIFAAGLELAQVGTRGFLNAKRLAFLIR